MSAGAKSIILIHRISSTHSAIIFLFLLMKILVLLLTHDQITPSTSRGRFRLQLRSPNEQPQHARVQHQAPPPDDDNPHARQRMLAEVEERMQLANETKLYDELQLVLREESDCEKGVISHQYKFFI